MASTILKTNHGECPLWGVPVSVSGWYRSSDAVEWTFSRAECPIIANSKLNPYDQDLRYKYMRCEDCESCSLYTEFQASITSAR